MQGQHDLLVKYLKLKTSVPMDRTFTNRFVDGAYKRIAGK